MFDVIYQWIHLNELYKLMESFLSNFEFLAENVNFLKRIARREYWANCNVLNIMDFSQRALQTNVKLIFQISNNFSKFCPKNENFSNRVNIDWSEIYYNYINWFDSTRSTN